MAEQEQAPVRAPEFPQNVTWIQGGPKTMLELKGQAVLIDFWDYTCVNCINTLPYVQEWHKRYADAGLTIIGVHAPEFSFAHNGDHVRAAIAEHGLEYPIVQDNEYAIWQAYANRYWPAKYLINHEGYLKYYHFGEGAYQQTEEAIQSVLKEAFPEAVLPALMDPVRDTDAAGAVCYRVTPELYLGYQRGSIGNVAGVVPDRPSTYNNVDKRAEGYFYLEGDWQLTSESSARPIGAVGESKLHVRYMAKELNLVMVPPLAGGEATVELFQTPSASSGQTPSASSGQAPVPLAAEDAGSDVQIEDGKAVVKVGKPGLYRLVNNREIDTYDLTLSTTSDGIAMYAFTFTSCLVPEM
jgi:thiol-disulfide isomerase/thioredoxin